MRGKALRLESLESRLALSTTPTLIDFDSTSASNPEQFVTVGDLTYFVATDTTNGRELWVTDGSTTGTRLVADINTGNDSSTPSELVNVDGTLYFTAFTEEDGRELWTTDGTEEGTMMVADIFGGTFTSNYQEIGNSSNPTQLTAVGGTLYFTARDGENGFELWKSDGTAEGTELVRDIDPRVDEENSTPESSNPANLTDVDGVLFFSADDGENGEELWMSDGTTEGTQMVRDIFTGTGGDDEPNSSFPGLFVAKGDELFFVAENDEVGAELWKSDGTEAGTVLVADINTGEASAFTNTSQMVVLDELLLFTANDGESGLELWSSDGTEVGTQIVEDINPGEDSGLTEFSSLTVLDGQLYFSADDGTTGAELWMSDGTESGTALVAEINSASYEDETPQGSSPTYFALVDGTVYFSAFTQTAGRELWQTDGTVEGTRQVADFRLTTSSFEPNNLIDVNGQLFFSGQTDGGRELFTLQGGDSVQLSIYADGVRQNIPGLIGVEQDGNNAEAFTLTDDGQVFFNSGAGVTLADFFSVWQTDGGLAGNNPDAVLTSTQVLGFETDFENTLQVFVDGQIVTDFVGYELQGGEQIDIVYGDNPVVAIVTNFGTILVELFDNDAPQTVDNFLNYVNDGDYENSFFHRSVENFVIQAGGFTTDSTVFTDTSQFGDVPTDGPVQGEVGLSNTQGTVAMANIGSNPDTATNQFFFNLVDNSQTLDSSFTVFGQILAMTTVDAIASLPIDMSNERPFDELPVSVADELAVISSVEGQGELSGVAYYDLDGDGTQDENEAGIAGARVFLDENGDGDFDEGEAFVLTDSEGRYLLQTKAGDYTLMIVPLVGASFSDFAVEDGYEVTVEIGREVSDLDFAFEVTQVPTGIDLVPSSDTGSSDTDNLTNLNNESGRTFEVLVSGTVFGAVVNLFADGVLIGSAVSDGPVATVSTDGINILNDGVHELTATLSFGDVEGGVSDSLAITIDSVAPAAIPTSPDEIVGFGESFSYDPQSADEGAAGVTYSLEGAPEGMTINPVTGEIAWTPSEFQTGPREFTILLSDEAGNFASQEVDLTVLAAIPTLPDSYEVNEDDTLTVSVDDGLLVNDGGDISGTLLAWLTSEPTHGELQLNDDGSFTYTPDDDFFGEDSFTYQAVIGDDAAGNVAKVTITVNPVQDNPVAVGDDYELNEDEPLTVDAENGLLSNDTDVDGDQLTAVLVTGPSNGTLDLNDDGSFVYTPDEHFNGADSFTYQVSDGTTTSDPVSVDLTINAVEDDPIAVDDAYEVDEDDTLEVNADLGLLANDLEPDGDDLTIDLGERPENGSVVLQSDGSFTYTPDEDFFGTDTFTYIISDGFREAEATVTVTVAPLPDPPTAENDSIAVVINGGQQQLDVLGNDSDPDESQVLTIVAVTQGDQGGTVEISEDGQSVLFTPAVGFEGTDTFEYTIEDEDGLTSTATVLASVSITPSGVIAGVVFLDADGDGLLGTDEVGIPGTLVTLTGTTESGIEVERTAVTDDEGGYSFEGLNSGTYTVTQSQPLLYVDGIETTDSPDAEVGVNDAGDAQISNIVLDDGIENTFVANNFSELSVSGEYVSVTWFFASNIANTDYVREVMANAEEARGNLALAEAIRNGDTTLDDDEEEAAAEPAVEEVFEEEASEQGEPLPEDEEPAEVAAIVEEDSESYEESADEALAGTDSWLEE